MVVGIVSARPVNGLVRRSTVLVGMRNVGIGRPVIVGHAPRRIDPAWVEVRIVRGRAVARIVRGRAVARIVRGRAVGIVSVQRVNGLVRRSTVLVGMRHVGTAQPVIVGHARPRIDPAWVEVRIVRDPRPQVTPIARSIARGWSVRATP